MHARSPFSLTFTNAPPSGWYARALSPVYFGAINRRRNAQFRLRFVMPSNKNSTANYLSFHSGDFTTTPSLHATCPKASLQTV